MRLLIVDDNIQFLEAARTLLEREGLSVVAVASTSDDAVRSARELRPDVTLVDVDLGDESGFDLARELTRSADSGGAPVVLISAYREADLRDLIDASPAVGFLPKARLSRRAIHDLVAGRGVSDPRGM
jgi:DNA-binding NarL/FixJ family response regulator